MIGASAGSKPADAWSGLIHITPTEEEDKFAIDLSAQLGAGKRSCLAVAIARTGVLSSDDLLAGRRAREHGVEVTGTIGMLLAYVRRGYLTLEQANHLLTNMVTAGDRSPVERLDDLLKADRT